jgi:hypothetical protein
MILTMQRRVWTTDKYNKKWFWYRTIMRKAFWFQMEGNGGGDQKNNLSGKEAMCGRKCWRHKDMGALVSLIARPIAEKIKNKDVIYMN